MSAAVPPPPPPPYNDLNEEVRCKRKCVEELNQQLAEAKRELEAAKRARRVPPPPTLHVGNTIQGQTQLARNRDYLVQSGWGPNQCVWITSVDWEWIYHRREWILRGPRYGDKFIFLCDVVQIDDKPLPVQVEAIDSSDESDSSSDEE